MHFKISSLACAKRAKVAIGASGKEGLQRVLASASEAQQLGYAVVTVITDVESSPPADVEVKISKNPGRDLILLLVEEKVDACVRGCLAAKLFLNAVKELLLMDKILRGSLLETPEGELLLLGPVGIDEGSSLNERLEFAKRAVRFMQMLECKPLVAVLSGGRLEDLGRIPEVDKMLAEGEFLASCLQKMDVEVFHPGILLEEALKKGANIVVAPNGIIGNLLFRALSLIAGWVSYGAPVLTTSHAVVDTSRSRESYVEAIALASALALRAK